MNIVSMIALPLGCMVLVGITLAVVWGINRAITPAVGNTSEAIQDDRGIFSNKRMSFLLSPLGLALIHYAFLGIPLWIAFITNPDFGMIVFLVNILAFTVYSLASPILIIFLPRGWLHSLLFVPCWFLLYAGIFAPVQIFVKEGIGDLGIALGAPMMFAGILFPVSVLVQVARFAVRKLQSTP